MKGVARLTERRDYIRDRERVLQLKHEIEPSSTPPALSAFKHNIASCTHRHRPLQSTRTCTTPHSLHCYFLTLPFPFIQIRKGCWRIFILD